MGEKKDNGYKELQISNVRWCTEFFLVSPGTTLEREKFNEWDQYPKIDFSKYYDIKTQDGQVFEGSRVHCHTHTDKGLNETSSSSIGFFQAGSLEATLTSGFLMRFNEKVTEQMQAKKREEERKEKLQELYEKRSELDEQIKGLESS